MRNTLSTILSLAIFLISTKAKCQVTSFQGNWSFSTNTSEFSLSLSQKGNSFTGSHRSILQNANKIDCSDNSAEASITGIVNDSAIVTFKVSLKISLEKQLSK